MSQIKFHTTFKGERVQVCVGYDRPFNHYFYNIYKMDAAPDEDDLIESSLDDPDADMGGGYASVDILFSKLSVFELPVKLSVKLREIIERNEGNVVYHL